MANLFSTKRDTKAVRSEYVRDNRTLLTVLALTVVITVIAVGIISSFLSRSDAVEARVAAASVVEAKIVEADIYQRSRPAKVLMEASIEHDGRIYQPEDMDYGHTNRLDNPFTGEIEQYEAGDSIDVYLDESGIFYGSSAAHASEIECNIAIYVGIGLGMFYLFSLTYCFAMRKN